MAFDQISFSTHSLKKITYKSHPHIYGFRKHKILSLKSMVREQYSFCNIKGNKLRHEEEPTSDNP